MAALSIKIVTITLSIAAIYFQDLAIIANDAIRNDLMSYILAIPPLFVYLIYRRRKMLKAAISFENLNPDRKPKYPKEIIGVLLCLTAFLLYWHGSYTFYPLEFHLTSLPLFTAGLVLIIFNMRTLRVLAFPIAFLLFLTPPPTEIISIAAANVATLSSDVTYAILKTIGLPVSQITEFGAPAIAVTDTTGSQVSFVVGTASSGIYSILGFSIFATFIMYIARGATWKKSTLFLASIPLVYILTMLRIVALVSLGYWQGVNVAWDIFHLLGASVLIFLGSIILLALSEKIWKLRIFTTAPVTTQCPTCNQNEKAKETYCLSCGKLLRYPHFKLTRIDVGKITVLIAVTILIVTLSVPVFALSERPPEVLMKTIGNEQTTAAEIFPQIPKYNLTFVYRDTQFEKVATRDRALVYAYTPKNMSEKTIFIAMEIGSSRSTWHSWEASVIIWPQQQGRPAQGIQLDLREVQLLQNPPLIGKYFAFQHTSSNTKQVVLYWMESAFFNTGSSQEQKYVKLSLVVYPTDSDEISRIEDLLYPFAEAIINYWQPIKTWSQISLTIAQNGGLLTVVPAALLILIVIGNLIQNQRNKKSNLKVYNQLSQEQEKLGLQAVQESAQKGEATTSSIASEYKKLTGTSIDAKQLLKTLEQAEKLGLVKRSITSVEDQPIIVWKSQIQLQVNLLQKLTSKANKIFGVITSPINNLRKKIRV
jgi:exosortase